MKNRVALFLIEYCVDKLLALSTKRILVAKKINSNNKSDKNIQNNLYTAYDTSRYINNDGIHIRNELLVDKIHEHGLEVIEVCVEYLLNLRIILQESVSPVLNIIDICSKVICELYYTVSEFRNKNQKESDDECHKQDDRNSYGCCLCSFIYLLFRRLFKHLRV